MSSFSRRRSRSPDRSIHSSSRGDGHPSTSTGEHREGGGTATTATTTRRRNPPGGTTASRWDVAKPPASASSFGNDRGNYNSRGGFDSNAPFLPGFERSGGPMVINAGAILAAAEVGGGGGDRGGGGGFLSNYGNVPIPPDLKTAADKVFYELHIVGIPPAIENGEAFTAYLNEVLTKQGLTNGHGDPVLATRIHTNYAFVLFRSREETTRALEINGISCLGSILKIDRPRGYLARLAQIGGTSDSQLMTLGMSKTQAITSYLRYLPRHELKRMLQEEIESDLKRQSRVVVLKGVMDPAAANDPPEALAAQVRSEAERNFGGDFANSLGISGDVGTGVITVRTPSNEQAQKVYDFFATKTFDGRRVKCEFVPDGV